MILRTFTINDLVLAEDFTLADNSGLLGTSDNALKANVSFDNAADRTLTLGNNVMINLGDKIFYGEGWW
jgi:hypothetical protein